MAKRIGARRSEARSGDMPQPPDCGDLVWLSFSPQAGREQAGRRPGMVLSPRSYNEKVGLCLLCPITHLAKGYPFEVALPEDLPITGVVLVDHVKSADWRERGASHIASVPEEGVVIRWGVAQRIPDQHFA
jgi:mRNA interferase MazF